EADVAGDGLRLQMQAKMAKELREVKEPQEEMSAKLQQLEKLQAAAREREVDFRAELEKVGEAAATSSAKLRRLDTELRPKNGTPVGSAEVRDIVAEALVAPKLKAQCQEYCEPLLLPLQKRLEKLATEVVCAPALATERAAREELGGLLRAEMQQVALQVSSRQKNALEQELRTFVEAVRRQLLESLEASSSRCCWQLKEAASSHSTEMRALSSHLGDVERFTHALGYAVQDMQKGRTKA
ncbi:unnamed protein product, partial [Effrenium voratum]